MFAIETFDGLPLKGRDRLSLKQQARIELISTFNDVNSLASRRADLVKISTGS